MTDVRMVPASDRLYQAVVQKRLTLPDSEEFRQHMANTIARHNRRGWRLDKPSLEQPNDSKGPCPAEHPTGGFFLPAGAYPLLATTPAISSLSTRPAQQAERVRRRCG